MSSRTTLQQRVREYMMALRIIGKLNRGDRLVLRGRAVHIQLYGWWTTIVRTVVGERREELLQGLDQFLADIDDLVTEYTAAAWWPKAPRESVSDLAGDGVVDTLVRLADALESVVADENGGLNALKKTYGDRPESVATLEELIERLRLTVRRIRGLSGLSSRRLDTSALAQPLQAFLAAQVASWRSPGFETGVPEPPYQADCDDGAVDGSSGSPSVYGCPPMTSFASSVSGSEGSA
jgi:hypothetical protein